MRFSTLLLTGIIILTGLNLVDAQPDISHDLFDNEHYIIVGHIYEPYTQDNEVVLINANTGECLKVTAIDCEHSMKEYLFNLANLHHGWTHDDEFVISYGNETIHFNIIEGSVAYQQDIQRPADVDPIYILTGFIIVAVGGGYFYMKKKKEYSEVTTLTEESKEDTKTGFKLKQDFGVRALIATLVTTGYIASILTAIYLNNKELIPVVTALYTPIVLTVITFYFHGSAVRDIRK